MKYISIKFKKYKTIIIFILFFNIINSAFLKVGCVEFKNEEVFQFNKHYLLLSTDEKPVNSFEITTEPDTQSLNNVSNLWLLNGVGHNSNEEIREISLADRHNDISNYFVEAFNDDLSENFYKYLALKYVTSFVGGFGPCIPQMAIALSAGKYYGSSLLSYFLFGATMLYIEGITTWMILEFIEDAQKIVNASKPTHANFGFCSMKFIKAAGVGFSSLLLGAISSAPDVYRTYKYNKIKSLSIISFIYDTIPRTLGFYKLFSSLNFESIKLCEEENPIKLKEKQFINLSKVYFLNKCKEKGVADVSLSLKNCTTLNEIYAYLSSNQSLNLSEETLLQYRKFKSTKEIIKYLILIFPLTSVSFNMILAYKGYNMLIDDQVLLILLSGFSVIPSFFLSKYVMMNACDNFFDKIYSYKFQIPSSNYFETFYPKINLSFISVSLLLGTSVTLSGFYVTCDNLENTPLKSAKYVFAILGGVTDMMFGSYAIYTTLINFAEVIKKINKESSYILSCLKKLEDVYNSIKHSSLDLPEEFVNSRVA